MCGYRIKACPVFKKYYYSLTGTCLTSHDYSLLQVQLNTADLWLVLFFIITIIFNNTFYTRQALIFTQADEPDTLGVTPHF